MKNYAKLTVPMEIKQLNGREFSGYGSTFGNVDWGGDMVMPGSFSKSLKDFAANGDLPPMFWMHDMAQVPGKWTKMQEDNNGLYVEGVLAKTPLGDEIYTLLKMYAISGMSIGYIPKQANYTNDGIRQLTEIDLIENSIVSLPMNPKAQIQHVKTRLSAKGEYVPTDEEIAEFKRDLERYMKGRGLSKSAARNAAAALFEETGAMPDPLLEHLESSGARLDDSVANSDGAMLDVIEFRAGMKGIEDGLLAKEIAKIYRRTVNG